MIEDNTEHLFKNDWNPSKVKYWEIKTDGLFEWVKRWCSSWKNAIPEKSVILSIKEWCFHRAVKVAHDFIPHEYQKDFILALRKELSPEEQK